MARSKYQTDFFKANREYGPHRSAHGGGLAAGRRKVSRPFKRNCSMHVVLKSSLAVNDLSLLGPRFQLPVNRIIKAAATRFGVKIHALQNVGSHIHLMVSAVTKPRFQNFLRAITSGIASLVTGARKGCAIGRKFWDAIPFSRLVRGARDFKAMLNYIEKNRLEAEVGGLSRRTVELWEAAERKARRTGRSVYEFL